MTQLTARTDALIVETLEEGLVLYDTRAGAAHLLDPVAASVWQLCMVPRTEAELAAASGLSAEAIGLAVDHLIEGGLLLSPDGAHSRRAMLRRAVKVGVAGAAAAPLVSVLIPAAAAHASILSS